MASGLPVIATRVGGIPEAVWEGVSGHLFDPRRPSEAATFLRSIVREPAAWRCLSEGAVRAMARFDGALAGQIVEGAYAELLGADSIQ
jgi:glycosyltransferase involved in cell wall biosynthesis